MIDWFSPAYSCLPLPSPLALLSAGYVSFFRLLVYEYLPVSHPQRPRLFQELERQQRWRQKGPGLHGVDVPVPVIPARVIRVKELRTVGSGSGLVRVQGNPTSAWGSEGLGAARPSAIGIQHLPIASNSRHHKLCQGGRPRASPHRLVQRSLTERDHCV